MDTSQNTTTAQQLLTDATNVLIATHEHPTADSIGSALALSLGLVSLGKKVIVACPDPITVELSSFVGVNKIVADLARKNFVISLDYVDGSIEKVSYNIEGDKFNLVIEPRPGFDLFSPEKVHYSTSGALVDCIITVDTIHFGGLKKLYEADKGLFATKPILNIDRHPNNAQYGRVNLVDAAVSTTAELVAQVLSSLGVALTADIATNLLNALYEGTNNFSMPAVSASAFEVAASCIRAGGKRFAKLPPVDHHSPAPSVADVHPKPASPVSQPAEAHLGQVPPSGHPPASTPAPADWLKPKIFKSSNLL